MKALIAMMTTMATVIRPPCYDHRVTSSAAQRHSSSSENGCNHPFCSPPPSVFPFPCIRINLRSFIVIVSYLLNGQSQWRAKETKAHCFENELKYVCTFSAAASFKRNVPGSSRVPKESVNAVRA